MREEHVKINSRVDLLESAVRLIKTMVLEVKDNAILKTDSGSSSDIVSKSDLEKLAADMTNSIANMHKFYVKSSLKIEENVEDFRAGLNSFSESLKNIDRCL